MYVCVGVVNNNNKKKMKIVIFLVISSPVHNNKIFTRFCSLQFSSR